VTSALKKTLVVSLLFLPLLFSCGKKGPPRLPTYAKPPTPTGQSAVRRGTEVILTWQYGQDEGAEAVKGFTVLRKGDEGFVRIAFPKERLFLDMDVLPGSVYEYRVLARSARDFEGAKSETLKVGPAEGLDAPSALVFRINPGSVGISWEYPPGGALFSVYRRAEDEEYPLSPLNKAPLEGTYLEDEPHLKGTVYYSVRAVRHDTAGGVTYEGPQSVETAVSPGDYVPSAPVGLEAVISGGEAIVFWRENPEVWVKGYAVYRSLGDGKLMRLGVSHTTAFKDPGPFSLKRTYRVKAMGPVVEGRFSKPVSVYPPRG
jgi:fibronectin type 3 domain-containing protein